MNQILEQIAKAPLVVKLVVLVVLVVIIGAVEFQVFLVPKKAQLAKLQKKNADLTQQLVENQAVAANYQRFQEEINILNEQLKQAVTLLPNEANIHTILRQISITAKKSNVDILFFKPGGTAKRGFYSEIGMELKLRGTYHDIASYIDQMGKLSRIINVSNIVFSGVTAVKNSITLTLDCRATTFMFSGGGARK